MKIAIYETVHLDWLIPYMELFYGEDIKVFFFTTTNLKKDVEKVPAFSFANYKWHFIDEVISAKKFHYVFSSFIKSEKFDLLILNSIDAKNLIIFADLLLHKPKKIIVNLHDINNFFKPQYSFRFKHFIRTLGKQSLKLMVNGFIVNAEEMKEYIVRKGFTSKKVFWIPPVFYKGTNAISNATKMTALVAGSIDIRRRDYECVLKCFEIIWKKGLNIELILAGRPVGSYGMSIVEKAASLQAQGHAITFFKDEVPEVEFQEYVSRATILISPLKTNTTIHDNITEVYGQSKGSGNIYDAIRHGKPIVLPENIKVPKEIKSSCIFYDSDKTLESKLLNFVTHNEVKNFYTFEAIKNASQFTKESTRQKLLNAIKEITS